MFKKLFKAVIISAVLLAFSPNKAYAQFIPVEDKTAWIDRTIVLMGRGADWFLTANTWLTETRKKTDAMIQQTEIVRRTTRKYEDMALGELGQLGSKVPTYNAREDLRVSGSEEYGVSAICSVSKEAARICTQGLKLRSEYERAMNKLVTNVRYADSTIIASVRDSVETNIYRLLGPNLQMRARMLQAQHDDIGSGVMAATKSMEISLVTPLEMARVQGEQAVTLQEVSEQIEIVADSAAKEAEAGPISSGRARQLDALLTVSDVKAEIELARGKVGELEAFSLLTANQLRSKRRTLWTHIRGAGGI